MSGGAAMVTPRFREHGAAGSAPQAHGAGQTRCTGRSPYGREPRDARGARRTHTARCRTFSLERVARGCRGCGGWGFAVLVGDGAGSVLRSAGRGGAVVLGRVWRFTVLRDGAVRECGARCPLPRRAGR
ncbi:hypothetical protein GCM10010295_26830 [Streptomyces intermedius]